MAVQGGIRRLRTWKFGKQTVFGTAVAATRTIGWSGALVVDPNWTDQTEVDVGSIDTILPPYRTQTDVSASLSGPLTYDDLSLIGAAGLIGGVAVVTSQVSRQTWTFNPVSLTATTLDYFTAYWSDEVTRDGFRARDGVIEDFELGFDDALGPWQATTQWRFGYVDPHVIPTAGLTIGSNLALVFGADTAIYIDPTFGTIFTTLMTDSVHRASIKVTTTIDQKRYAQGSNSRFAISGYGVAERMITASFTFAKSTQITNTGGASEVDRWLASNAVNRYVRVRAASTEIIPLSSAAAAYIFYIDLCLNWKMRTDEEIGGNTAITLEGTARYDATMSGPMILNVDNNRATLP